MLKRLLGLAVILGWFGFAALIATFPLPAALEVVLAIIGIALTLLVLALSGRMSKRDPLTLNLTAHRPHY
ncbi:hypothetical protein [Woodsholea maritima]|uniref:hypothetical protein n=1 Tax=Woodsholea maritima TaxID=240237 RepID=UPI00037BC0CC|nr:hypothetical protein [Woodsholea maritima]